MYWQAGFTGAHVRCRAAAVIWRAHVRGLRGRARQHRHLLTSVLLVAAGLAGGLAGGALVGRWCLGVVLIAESGGAVWFGLMRDDGGQPQVRTVGDDIAERLRQ